MNTSPELFLMPTTADEPSAQPPLDTVPRWQVYMMSAVGSDAYFIIGTDGNGFTKFMNCLPCEETYPGEREFEKLNIARKVEILRAKAESRAPRLTPTLRLHVVP